MTGAALTAMVLLVTVLAPYDARASTGEADTSAGSQ